MTPILSDSDLLQDRGLVKSLRKSVMKHEKTDVYHSYNAQD